MARQVDAGACGGRGGAMNQLPRSVVDALTDWRALQQWAAVVWDIKLTNAGAIYCLRDNRAGVKKVLKAWNTGHGTECWTRESSVGCWLKMRAVAYVMLAPPSARPAINPHRVDYPLTERVAVLYEIRAHAVGGMDGDPSFDNAVRTYEEYRCHLENNEIFV